MREMTGSDAWFGGWWNRTGGHVNPLMLARGMAHRAAALGATLFARLPVLTVEHREGAGW
jgi:glycine/D-amino acid oxidase-like deaminating enzyme